jgi:hypothetical protein
MRFVSRVLAAALLAVALIGVLPAVMASAATTYTVIWISPESTTTTITYACSAGIQTYYGENVDEIKNNGCSDRVWMHQYTDGDGNSYCVNPGAITYGFSYKYGDFAQVEPTTNPFDCDNTTKFGFEWSAGGILNPGSSSVLYSYCQDGYTDTNPDPLGYGGYDTLLAVDNTCNTRIWVHELNGTALACVSPVGYAPANGWDNTGGTGGIPAQQYQVTANQAPCSAG